MGVTWITFKSDSSTVHYGNSPSDLPFSAKGSQTEWITGNVTRFTHRVCIFGDLGRHHGNSTASIIRNGLAGMFDFVVHVGDIAYDLQDDDGKNGDKFMNQLEPLISRIPYMVVAGNHEYEDGIFPNFQQRFWMPPNGRDGNQFYSFDLGPVHWTALSTEYYGFYQDLGSGPILDQYKWLKNDLEIRIGNDDVPGLEKPFIQHGVDIGFWGHENCYHNAQAPTYIITGSAGCHSPGTKFDKHPVPFSAKRLNDYGYTIVTVANMTHIHLQQLSIDEDEAIVDDFWISKDLGSGVTKGMRV
ncbi:Ser/Thr phosphatase family protein [Ancylostoma duodenale]|uniref:Purple acid phosphatase n=1 Tax=Ancylostoma duodenale TaxID=51022 RepID=A0A0C2GBE1_9BILA|nr:Ser/Thr phosphatase family protein [Ancylostoma duodenale]